jgi:hypothetical protein
MTIICSAGADQGVTPLQAIKQSGQPADDKVHDHLSPPLSHGRAGMRSA